MITRKKHLPPGEKESIQVPQQTLLYYSIIFILQMLCGVSRWTSSCDFHKVSLITHIATASDPMSASQCSQRQITLSAVTTVSWVSVTLTGCALSCRLCHFHTHTYHFEIIKESHKSVWGSYGKDTFSISSGCKKGLKTNIGRKSQQPREESNLHPGMPQSEPSMHNCSYFCISNFSQHLMGCI